MKLVVFRALVGVAGQLVRGLRWRPLPEGASLWHTPRAIHSGLFVNELFPLRPGEAVRAWLAARDFKIGIRTIVPTMLTVTLSDGIWQVTSSV